MLSSYRIVVVGVTPEQLAKDPPSVLRRIEDHYVAARRPVYRAAMAEKKGNGSATAQRANTKAAKEGKKNPRTSSAAQAELGKKGGSTEKS